MQKIDELLGAIERQLEQAPLSDSHKLKGLDACRLLKNMVREGTVDSPTGFARVADLELSEDAPATIALLDHFQFLRAGIPMAARRAGERFESLLLNSLPG